MKILRPYLINDIELPNRITIAPMCQYSGINGNPTNWHYGHLQQLSLSGAGLLTIESTAVNYNGRITLKDLVLKDDKNEREFKKLINHIRHYSKIPIGIQISHAGRKGSSEIPWIKPNRSLKKKKWLTHAPSAIKKDAGWPIPKALNFDKMQKIIKDFKNAAIRANRIGFDCLEIHMAHGYLLHQFFSPISNNRKDEYGGSLKKRCRLLTEITEEIRKVWPKNKILGVRVTGQDWLEHGSSIDDCIYLVNLLKEIGINYACVSSGGIITKTNLVFKEGYQTHLAKIIKKKTKIITRAGGMISNYAYAKKIVENNSVDLINVARRFINDPTWLIKLQKKPYISDQYKKCF
jgi:2,4-dienoyl-CoA reductase-like NADH-dependent reductase (Old Yellow Enzyme family)